MYNTINFFRGLKECFKYLFLHKYYVLVYCFKHKLYIQGLLHDLDKFLPHMIIAYTKYFHSDGFFNKSKNWDKDGYSYKLTTGNEQFELAWLGHLHRNKHHWQHWVAIEGDKIKPYRMPYKYALEMVLDWKSAGRVQNNPHSTKEWFKINKHKMVLHKDTLIDLENILSSLED